MKQQSIDIENLAGLMEFINTNHKNAVENLTNLLSLKTLL